jgi:ubiquinone/menaquinone biosynthesis C-methylase UbiE
LPGTSSPSDIFKIKDATSYDDVSGHFDEFTRVLSLPFAERMVGLAGLRPSDRILDVGTGTGIVALNAARAAHKGQVTGVDLSEGMLATARQNAVQSSAGRNVEFRSMDAEALEFEDRSFDVVLSLFALLHFPNPSAAVKQMFRVLRPGGRLVLAVGSRPDLLSMATIVQGVRHVRQLALERTGRLLVAPAFLEHLVEKHLPGVQEAEISALAHAGLNRTGGTLAVIREARFTDIQTSWFGHQAYLKTAEDFWRIQSTFSSLARKRLSDASQDKAAAVRQEFFEVCRQVEGRGGRFVYPRGAFFVSARKPDA